MFKILILVLAVAGSAYADYESYGSMPPMATPIQESQFMNPCTEEVMRSPEIQLFANANDQSSYLICTDVNTPISMPCSPGTVFDTNLRHCIPIGWEAPMCPVGTCLNHADCIINEMNQPSCICKVGFTGQQCEVNIDECAFEGNNVCYNAGGQCIDQINGFYCEFNEGSEIGLSASTKIQRPCSLVDLEAGKQFYELDSELGNVFLQCTGEWTFTVSKCADMLFWHQELRTCSIERPLPKTGVCKNYPCMNDGECIDMGGNSFTCECKEGWTGDMCEVEIDWCLNNPCQNGGRCVSYPGGYNCMCEDLIVDKSCSTGVTNPCQGSNEYFPNNVDMTKYVSCRLGFGFVKSCAPGLMWNQDTLTCIRIEELVAPQHQRPPMSAFRPTETNAQGYGESYGERAPMSVQAPASYQSYGQQEAPKMAPTPAPVQSYGGERTHMTVPQSAPVQSYGGERAPITVPQMAPVKSYGGERTHMTVPQSAPVKSYGGERVPMAAPARPSYSQEMPQMAPTQQGYGSRLLSFLKY